MNGENMTLGWFYTLVFCFLVGWTNERKQRYRGAHSTQARGAHSSSSSSLTAASSPESTTKLSLDPASE